MRLYVRRIDDNARKKSRISKTDDGLVIRIQNDSGLNKELELRQLDCGDVLIHVKRGPIYVLNGTVHEFHTTGAKILHNPNYPLNLSPYGFYRIERI